MESLQTRLLTATAALAKVFRQWSRKAEEIRIVTAWATKDCAVFESLCQARGEDPHDGRGTRFSLDIALVPGGFLAERQDRRRPGGRHVSSEVVPVRGRHVLLLRDGQLEFYERGIWRQQRASELNICIEGSRSEPFFRQVSLYIDGQEKRSEGISQDVFEEYKGRYAAFRSDRQRFEKFHASKRVKARARAKKAEQQAGREPPDNLNLTWPEFVKEILAGERRRRVVDGNPDEPSYLKTAEDCRGLFDRYKRLAAMPLRDRRFVGGTIREAARFGSMTGNGRFMRHLNDAPAKLDDALNHIPLGGAVSRRNFDAFAERYDGEGLGVATGSRLLAMKRPDVFICVNSENRTGIARTFGVPASSLSTFKGYWELIERIRICPWWKEQEPPSALDLPIWRARVALLDSLYYSEAD